MFSYSYANSYPLSMYSEYPILSVQGIIWLKQTFHMTSIESITHFLIITLISDIIIILLILRYNKQLNIKWISALLMYRTLIFDWIPTYFVFYLFYQNLFNSYIDRNSFDSYFYFDYIYSKYWKGFTICLILNEFNDSNWETLSVGIVKDYSCGQLSRIRTRDKWVL